MRIVELFAGIGACSTALKRIGIDIEIVDAVEIDKYAIASFNAIHNTNFEVQDVTTYNKELKDIDLITHGSPCQDFSVAGKQAGGDLGSGTRSSLLYETVRIVGQARPKYILWENVKNILSKKHKHNFDNYINEMDKLGYNSYYQILNAKDYGIPQNRERVYTVSIRKDIDNEQFEFPKKETLKLKLKDVLETNVDDKYYLSEKMVEGFKKHNKNHNAKGTGFIWKTRDVNGTASTLRANGSLCPTDNTINVEEVKAETNIIGSLVMNKWQDFMKRIYDIEKYAPTISTMQGGNTEPKILLENENIKIRKLTPLECWRLMGFTDIEFKKAQEIGTSNTQLYKQARKQYSSKCARKNI